MDKPIYIIGFMGSGKTTWGKKLANRLDIPFIDIDHLIVEKVGVSIPEYFNQLGEKSFRELERDVLRDLDGQYAIISTGGGTPCYHDNMDWMLQNGTTVYFKHSVASLWARLNASDPAKRPALKGLRDEKLVDFISEKLAERTPYYQRAEIIIDQINTDLDALENIIKEKIEHDQN